VLLLDVVGSTTIASELGDARWRVILIRFRRIVRRELKRHDGHEQDTAGDGFCVTFAEPVQALRCAAAIAAAVQELGLDVRAGVHTGECAEIDGKLGGIAVHISARIMSLAGAAEVVTTGTTKDLVVGSRASFEDQGLHQLKGVEGEWRVYALRSIEVELPLPLDPEVAASRLRAVALQTGRRRRWPVVAVVVGVGVAALSAGAVAAHFTGEASGPPTLVRLDPSSGRIVSRVHDGQPGCGPCGPNLWVVDGTLWALTGADGRTISIRSLTTGKLIRTVALSSSIAGLTVGFGAVWVVEPGPQGSSAPPTGTVERIDGLSGRTIAKVPLHGNLQLGRITTGSDAIWVLDQDGVLHRIDPAGNRVSGRFATGALETFWVAPGAGYVWICECFNNNSMLRYDPRTRTARRFPLLRVPERWQRSESLRYVRRTFVVGEDGRTRSLWFLVVGGGGRLASWNPDNGRAAMPSVGLEGEPVQAAMANGNIWVAASTVVDRFSIASGKRETIPLPKGMNATGIAVDPVTNTVWVGNSTAIGAN